MVMRNHLYTCTFNAAAIDCSMIAARLENVSAVYEYQAARQASRLGADWRLSMRRRALLQWSLSAGSITLIGSAPAAGNATRITTALQRMQPRFAEVLTSPSQFRLQIEYSYPTAQGWQHESYRRDAEWTAPASTVKLPMAMFALHRLAQLKLPRSTQLRVIEPPACAAQADELAQFEPIEQTLKRMLIVSDNGAYNRLYEFVGGDRVPSLLRRFGFANAKLQARLGACTPADNALGHGVQLADASGALIWQDPVTPSIVVAAPEIGGLSTQVGKAYLDFNEQLINTPKDFQFSNHWRISDMHSLLLAIAGAQPHPLWDALSDADQAFLRQTLQTLPRAAGFDRVEYPDAWGKFLVHGDQKAPLPEGLRICNKIGEAYGFLLDSAWLQRGTQQCVVSAVIYVNSDGVLNDDKYEYDSVGVPFLAELGRQLLLLS
jgi:Beta-lactamase enzyme family